jgi:hypothetical protein
MVSCGSGLGMLQTSCEEGCQKYWMSRDYGSLPGRQVILRGIKHGPVVDSAVQECGAKS